MNISQTLFNADQKLAEQGNLKAYINQSRISTYYQDNPFSVLADSSKFNLPTLGGKIDGSKGAGSRPGVEFTLKEAGPAPVAVKNDIQLVNKGGIFVPSGLSNWIR